MDKDKIKDLPYDWRIKCWLQLGERGISSNTICYVLSGVKMLGLDPDSSTYHSFLIGYPPRDPADFRRCYLLLELIPEWKARLHEVAEAYPRWKTLVDNWHELERLYEEEASSGRCPILYERMQELREDANR